MDDCQVLKVKVSGDGTRVGKRLQILNVTFTIINERSVAATERGNYILAIVLTKDDYEGIGESLQDLREEMSTLKSCMVKNNVFTIELFLGGDWKFLACICGIGPAKHEYACKWCQCPRLQRGDTSKRWPLLSSNLGRTISPSMTTRRITKNTTAKGLHCFHLLKWII